MERDIDYEMLDNLCDEYASLVSAKEKIDAEIKNTKEKIKALMGDKEEVSTPHNDITLKRSDVWTWDSRKLTELLVSNPKEVKGVIDTKHTVDKKRYQSLDKTTRELIVEALTVSQGRINLTISRKT